MARGTSEPDAKIVKSFPLEMKKIISYILIFLCAKNICAQEKLLFIGATAHLGNGEKIENSIIKKNESFFPAANDIKK